MTTATKVYGAMDLKALKTMRTAFEKDLEVARSDKSKDFIIGRLYIVNWFIQQLLSKKGG